MDLHSNIPGIVGGIAAAVTAAAAMSLWPENATWRQTLCFFWMILFASFGVGSGAMLIDRQIAIRQIRNLLDVPIHPSPSRHPKWLPVRST